MQRKQLEAIIKSYGEFPLLIVGIRNSNNKRGIYDDNIIIITSEVFSVFTGNTDPTSYRKGRGFKQEKGMATLNTGLWKSYKFGKHKTYPAIIQTGGDVIVTRDGINEDYKDTGYFGINIHKGGLWTTSSEGCQTIKRDQWDTFYNLAKSEAIRLFGDKWNSVVIPYLLISSESTNVKTV